MTTLNIDLIVGQLMGELSALKESLKEISLMLKEIHSTVYENDANIRYLLTDSKDLHKKYHEVKGFEIILESHDKRLTKIELEIKELKELKDLRPAITAINTEKAIEKEVKTRLFSLLNNSWFRSIIIVILVLAGTEGFQRLHNSTLDREITQKVEFLKNAMA